MTHELTHEELFAYHDGELPAERRIFVEAHLQHCAPCRGQWSAWRAAAGKVFGPLRASASERFVQNVMRRVRACAPDFAAPRWELFMRWAYPALAFSITLCGVALNYSLQPANASVESTLLGEVQNAASTWTPNAPGDDSFFDAGTHQ